MPIPTLFTSCSFVIIRGSSSSRRCVGGAFRSTLDDFGDRIAELIHSVLDHPGDIDPTAADDVDPKLGFELIDLHRT